MRESKIVKEGTITAGELMTPGVITLDIESNFAMLEQINLNSDLLKAYKDGTPCVDCQDDDILQPKIKDSIRRENRELAISKLKSIPDNDFVTLSRLTIYVDDDNTEGPWDGTLDNPYEYIQDGIDNSNNGDTVFVFEGMYHENIIINKSINLIGESNSQTTIDANDPGNVVTGVADNIHIKNFTVKDGTYSGIWSYKIADSSSETWYKSFTFETKSSTNARKR